MLNTITTGKAYINCVRVMPTLARKAGISSFSISSSTSSSTTPEATAESIPPKAAQRHATISIQRIWRRTSLDKTCLPPWLGFFNATGFTTLFRRLDAIFPNLVLIVFAILLCRRLDPTFVLVVALCRHCKKLYAHRSKGLKLDMSTGLPAGGGGGKLRASMGFEEGVRVGRARARARTENFGVHHERW